MNPVTGLYVPGNRPDRFNKAVSSGADLVILDLEDAVPPAEKGAARDAVAQWLSSRAEASAPLLQVRVNAGYEADVAALAGLGVGLRVPKVEDPASLDALGTDFAVTAIIENAPGLERAFAIASHPAVTALALGESDLASDLGGGSAVIDHARLRVLVAARAAGLPAPMMSVYPRIHDLEGLRADTEHGRELGLRGRVAVHPSQLPVIAEVFRASEAEVAWAREVLEVTASGGVGRLESGEMVDPAMVGRANAILGHYVP